MKVNKESMLVYAITDRHWTGEKTLEQQVDEVLKNGATFLQIREKNMPCLLYTSPSPRDS